MKKVFLFLAFIAVFTLSAADFDKDVIVLDQTRNDKVKTVFNEMMEAYQEGDITKFFTYVSEDRFQQDYMTFYEAIDEDMRVYDVLSIETWVNKITEDGIRRYLYVQWDKRYESTQSSSGNEINQLGLSKFLFDEVNGEYKLIELAGNNFWGGSLPEWTEEVPAIAGQVVYNEQDSGQTGPSGPLPDLSSTVGDCFASSSDMQIQFEILNNGVGTVGQDVTWRIETDSGDVFTGSDPVGDVYTNNSTMQPSCVFDITVDYTSEIDESDEQNNVTSFGGP